MCPLLHLHGVTEEIRTSAVDTKADEMQKSELTAMAEHQTESVR
ncbi:hypothetical protein NTGZN8_340034 [Candidatus Nitrotoga fabula]|uniref:Uncharacterized protein n=1 Tax=Candidatus Nitrotoga fabula TaxID=2182327 RepID=A0A916BDD2_9PROT|nr:hypothetical protein NTGZN8_340034 [Candidatus Nitrotoga fabula]